MKQLAVSRQNEGNSLIEKLLEHLAVYERLLVRNEELKSL
jgi:hypothetical protein